MVNRRVTRPDLRSACAHADERGAAIFIVVLVLTMLTGIGVFAIRAATLSEAASGYDRQNTQNHYVGEYGLLGAVSELSSPRRDWYYKQMKKGGEPCIATKGILTTGTGVSVPCFPIQASDVQAGVFSNFSGRPLFEPATTSSGTVTPGSLGPAGLDGDFRVEMSDPGPVGMPVAGTDVGGTSAWRYYQVTLTSVGQVRPAGNSAVCAVTNAGVAGNETGRAFVVMGPLLGGK
jgi:hypothetical protein